MRTRSSCIRVAAGAEGRGEADQRAAGETVPAERAANCAGTSRADAHRSGVSIQGAANTPTTSTPCVSLHRPCAPRTRSSQMSFTPAPGHHGPWCSSSGRLERGLGLHHLPLRRFRSSRSPPETASPPSARRNTTL